MDIFANLRDAAPEGIEKMLDVIERDASVLGNYALIPLVRWHRRRLELGLPEDFSKAPDDLRWEKLHQEEPGFHVDVASTYECEGRTVEAAREYQAAGLHSKALKLYLKEGSPASKLAAASSALALDNYKLYFDVLLEQNEFSKFSSAFQKLERLPLQKEDFLPKDQQHWGEYLITKLYPALTEEAKTQQLVTVDGRPPWELFGSSLKATISSQNRVLKWRVAGDFVNSCVFWGVMKYAERSSDPEILKMSLELENLHKASGNNPLHLKRDYHLLHGLLTGDQEDIDYFVREARLTARDPKDGVEEAMNILMRHQRYDEALDFSDQLCSPDNPLRLECLEKLERYADIAKVYQEKNDPLNYALALAKIKP